jgi:hypothetical protein
MQPAISNDPEPPASMKRRGLAGPAAGVKALRVMNGPQNHVPASQLNLIEWQSTATVRQRGMSQHCRRGRAETEKFAGYDIVGRERRAEISGTCRTV